MIWDPITVPTGLRSPAPITVRVQSIPARHYFPEHAHRWNQLVYAVSGVLTVNTETDSFVITFVLAGVDRRDEATSGLGLL